MNKKLIAFVFVIITLSALIASCSSKRDSGTGGENGEYIGVDKYEIKSGVTVWASNGYDKIFQSASAPKGSSNTDSYSVYLAKNEAEAFQISIVADEKLEGITLEIGKVSSPAESNRLDIKLYKEHYVEVRGVPYPDAISPMPDTFDAEENKAHTFLVEIKADEKAEAGEYLFDVVLKSRSSGAVYGVVTAKVTVWSYALPRQSSCATAVVIHSDSIKEKHGLITPEQTSSMYKKYYETLLENRITPIDLPYDILDDRVNAYLSDPRVTAFKIPYPEDDRVLMAYYEKLSKNPEWMKKGYFYAIDEPNSIDHLKKLERIAARLEMFFPGYQLCTPFFTDISYDENTDQIDFMKGKTNIWCPKAPAMEGNWIYQNGQEKKYASFAERMEEQKAKGDKLWWYVCWEPGNPYCNLFVDQKGIQHRILFWQQKLFDVDGFLYWGANYWMDTSDPWTDMRTVKFLTDDVYGDGSLLYNGNKVGVDGPCRSLRLLAIRDGIEDFDMFTLAEAEFGKEWVNTQIQKVCSGLKDYTRSSGLFDEIRIEVGNALSEKYAGK